jgi:hypothetical protein
VEEVLHSFILLDTLNFVTLYSAVTLADGNEFTSISTTDPVPNGKPPSVEIEVNSSPSAGVTACWVEGHKIQCAFVCLEVSRLGQELFTLFMQENIPTIVHVWSVQNMLWKCNPKYMYTLGDDGENNIYAQYAM